MYGQLILDKHAKAIYGEVIVYQTNYSETSGYP
jgi:hypothetical protein